MMTMKTIEREERFVYYRFKQKVREFNLAMNIIFTMYLADILSQILQLYVQDYEM